MGHYTATVSWLNDEGPDFPKGKYSRGHSWTFDGGISVPASSSPHVVRLPFSREDAVDPEEALVASISSCHMLSFLWVAAEEGFTVDAYDDEAQGTMGKNDEGHVAVTRVELFPHTKFSGDHLPDEKQLNEMHHRAHEICFIANSVKTEILCSPTTESD